MNIRQAIQSTANVVRVTSIAAGDVYKRFDRDDDRVFFGIVKNVHNDGDKTFVEALEYCKQYGRLNVALKILRDTADYTLFPCDPSELELELDGIVAGKTKEIATKRDEIVKLEREIAEVEKLLSGETLRDLKQMSYSELSQNQFNEKKLAAAY